MAEGTSAGSAFIAAALGAAIAVGGSAFVIYNMTSTQRVQIEAKLAAIDAKLDKTNATVDAKLDKTNAVVAESKKADAGANDALKASSLDGINSTLGQIDGRINKLTASVTGLERATSANAQAVTDKSLGKAQEKIEGEVTGLKAALAAQKQMLDQIVQSVNKALERPAMAAKDDAAKVDRELVVVYMPRSGGSATETTGGVTPAPLSVNFAKIGAVNPQGQIDAVAANLKKIIKDRHGCTISIAGYADTLGGDKVNLDISRERAEAVAAKLRTAFAGQDVKIEKVGWGERQLKVWTPDGQGEMANRRVDISVDCKS